MQDIAELMRNDLCGQRRWFFTVHKAVLLNSGSSSLQELLKPEWIETSQGRIDWTHTNDETIERVLTFLYWGDYNSPEPTLRENQDQRNNADEARDTEHIVDGEGRVEQGWDDAAVEPVAEDAADEDLIVREDLQ